MKPWHKRNIFLNLVVVGAIIAITVYIIIRTWLFAAAQYSPVETVFAVMLISGELFILIHGFGYAINIFLIRRLAKERHAYPAQIAGTGDDPHVAVFVAARHEPREVLDRTFATICAMRYKNKEVFFLDDSSDERYQKEAQALCGDHCLVLFRRAERHGAKAGIINDCLKKLDPKFKYVVVFDADQNPMPEFLAALVPIMERREQLAFIQTPQFYSNIDTSAVARGAAFQQAVFYEYICEGKSSGGAMFCCGTNVIFRRSALDDVGGLDESSVTEDFATSLKFHTRGWRSLYYNHVSAFGMGPEDLAGYFKQQFRWAVGTISILRRVVWKFITSPFSLSLTQWWEYFLSSTYYLIGIAFFFMMICPIVYILLNVPSFFARPEIYFLSFVPYFILSMSVFYFLLAKRRYRPSDLFLGQLLGLSTFSVYMRAAVSGLLGLKTTFGVTGKTQGRAMPYYKLWPQILLVFVSFVTVVRAVNRFVYERDAALLVNGFWVFYYFVTLLFIAYFNENRRSVL